MKATAWKLKTDIEKAQMKCVLDIEKYYFLFHYIDIEKDQMECVLHTEKYYFLFHYISQTYDILPPSFFFMLLVSSKLN
jgi:hypothetical protein